MRLLGLTLIAIVAAGCARVVPGVIYRKVGKVDPEQEATTSEQMMDSIRQHQTTADQVDVVLDLMPPGLREAGDKLVIEPGYEHEVIGRVTVQGRKAPFFFLARFIDYRDVWRKALCYWQVPLEWLTLGIWSIVPLSYPCHASGATLTREEAIEDLRNAALPAGADLAIVFTGRARADDVKQMSAWLVRLDKRAAHEAPLEIPPLDTPPPPPPNDDAPPPPPPPPPVP